MAADCLTSVAVLTAVEALRAAATTTAMTVERRDNALHLVMTL